MSKFAQKPRLNPQLSRQFIRKKVDLGVSFTLSCITEQKADIVSPCISGRRRKAGATTIDGKHTGTPTRRKHFHYMG